MFDVSQLLFTFAVEVNAIFLLEKNVSSFNKQCHIKGRVLFQIVS